MLQHFWACYAPLFIYVADDKNGKSLFLGDAHYPHRAFAHLRDAARRGGYARIAHGLDGVNDRNVRLQLIDCGDDAVDIRLGKDIDVLPIDAETHRAQLELALTFLTGDVKYLPSRTCRSAHLEKQRRLADTRRTADKNERARDGSAAKHTVKLRYPGREPYLL